MIGTGLQLVASLGAVVGLLLLIAKLSARRLGGRAGAPVEVLARQSISRGSGVVVVRVGGRVLVLGATEQQVSLLTELDPHDIVTPEPPGEDDGDDDGVDEDVDPTMPETAFGDLVARARQRDTPLAGSIVSAQTWRQAFQAVSRPRDRAVPQGKRRAS